MKVFRLCKRKYSKILNGKGAAKSDNRWNSKGTEIIYTAESRALAMAEVAVHLTIGTLPNDYVMIAIKIPKNVNFEELDVNVLDKKWNEYPQNLFTQKIGDNFIDATSACVFKVPSAVVKGDFNYLINPYHKDFKKIKIIEITDFPFDKRIFQ